MSEADWAPYEKLERDDPRLGIVVSLTITYHPNGGLQVSGPVGDKQLCRWLIEHALDALKRGHTPTIVLPDYDMDKFIRENPGALR